MAINIDLSNLPKITNDIYLPLYKNRDRYLVLMGGGGSGKSVYASQKLLYRVLTEPGHRFLIVRKVARTLRESVFALLKGTISDWGMTQLFEINKTDMKITCKLNKNEILFAGLDDVEKLKSIYDITGVWIEEASEIDDTDFRQLDIRLRTNTPHYLQFLITFNPISITHWLKSEFFDKKKPNVTTLQTTYKDNKYLTGEAIDVLEAFKDTDPYYYQVYCLGMWGVLGKTIFDAQKVSERIVQIRDKKPLKQGYFIYEYENEKILDKSIKWIDDDTGYIRIYEDVKDNFPYVIGGDTSGEGSDYFIGQVLNNVTGSQVATLRHQFDEDLYARQMYCLGRYYNKALLGIEINYSTYPTKELVRLGYTKQYRSEKVDSITFKLKETLGFRTDKISRPVIISNLVQLVREHTELMNDIDTLEEMLTFVRNEKGRAEAQEGKHDDLIMGLAIAYYIRSQQSFSVEIPKQEDHDYTMEGKIKRHLEKITSKPKRRNDFL